MGRRDSPYSAALRYAPFLAGAGFRNAPVWLAGVRSVSQNPDAEIRIEQKVEHQSASELLSMRLIPLRQVDARRTEILNGRRGISPDTALRLSRYLGPSAAFWLNLQSQYDLARTADEKRSPFRARLRSGPQPVGDAAGVSGADLANLHMSREWNSRALRSRTRRS